jgi:CRISPR/Cas system-associated exonuclease Cas4 (RecB family)
MIKTFTSDHFETYKKCPRAYYYKYKKGIKFALHKDTYKLGRSIHSIVDYYLRGMPLSKIEANLDETTQEHWQNILKNPLLSKKLVCTEWGFDILLSEGVWLNGRIDAVFEDEYQSLKQYIIADWKTGENLPYAPEEKYQAMIYMYAFYKSQKDLGIEFEPHQLKFVFVSTKEENLEKQILCSEEMILEIEKNLAGMVDEIDSDIDFSPNKKSCAFCDFAQICE